MAPARLDDPEIPAPMTRPIPELPANTKLEYLAEGGANIVYKMTIPHQTKTDGIDEIGTRIEPRGKLLRLRKMINSGTPYVETVRCFDAQIKGRLFTDDELVAQELVRLPKGFIIACNERLKESEACGTRPEARCGVYLSTKEPFGLLITDMTPADNPTMSLWEFKPKWLLQSPSAPPDAKRCRTCALREMKKYDARKNGGEASPSFCPLDLVSDDFEDVLRALRFIEGESHECARVARILYQNPTLLKLQECQRQLNAVGLPGLEADHRDRAVSMTLRDCTMFVKIPLDETEKPEVRLGDLDFKSGVGGKLQYWRGVETRLIEEGWYNGTRFGRGTSECSLERHRAVVPLLSEDK